MDEPPRFDCLVCGLVVEELPPSWDTIACEVDPDPRRTSKFVRFHFCPTAFCWAVRDRMLKKFGLRSTKML
jgi:hypothetical protein